MSFFYLRADFFGDQTMFDDSMFLQNQYISISSENFDSPSFILSVAKSYLSTLNLGGSGTYGSRGVAGSETVELNNNGNTFDIANLYLLCGYKSGELKCVSADAATTIENVDLVAEENKRQ
jgi:hypothetical protein